MNEKRKRIYISGPITNNEDYIEQFDNAMIELGDQGYIPVRPIGSWADDPYTLDYKEHIELDLALLRMCDGICMLDGWETSDGSRAEKAYAECLGMEVMYETKIMEEAAEAFMASYDKLMSIINRG